jgi:hypothetical protein
LLLLPSSGVGQNKPNAKNVKQEVTTEDDYAKLTKAKEVSGKITTLDPTAKSTTLRYEYPTYEPIPPKAGQTNKQNQAYNALLRQQQKLASDYQQIMRAKNVAQQQQRLARWQLDYQQLQLRMAQYQNSNPTQFKTVTHTKDFEFDIEPEVKVTRLTLPLEYDDKGKVKEYTKEELKKMKDKDYPGYTAKFEDVQPGQTVKFYLKAPPKPSKTKKVTEPKKDGEEPKKDGEVKEGTEKKVESEKKTDPDAKPDTEKTTKGAEKGTEKGADDGPRRPTVRAIVIVSDPDPADTPAKGKRKKNDQ